MKSEFQVRMDLYSSAATLRRFSTALIFTILVSSSLRIEALPFSLCIVQIKPDEATRYDPSAGPWATLIYKHLAGQKLRNGAPLKITVLAASVEMDVLLEARRLQCALLVQLWFQHLDSVRSRTDMDSLLFVLRDTGTGKEIDHGAAPFRASNLGVSPLFDAPRVLARQIYSRLNRLADSAHEERVP